MKIANAIFLLATLSSAAADEKPLLRASVLIGGVAADDVDVDASSHQNDVIVNQADETEQKDVPEFLLGIQFQECEELDGDKCCEEIQGRACNNNNGVNSDEVLCLACRNGVFFTFGFCNDGLEFDLRFACTRRFNPMCTIDIDFASVSLTPEVVDKVSDSGSDRFFCFREDELGVQQVT